MRKYMILILTGLVLLISTNINAAEPLLRLGSRDSEMTKLQSGLVNIGYTEVDVNGYYDLKTLAAIIKLQQDNELKVDGIIGANTRKIIYVGTVTDSKSYTEEDLYWLSRLIYAESNGESYEGKLAVGNCVLNRVRSNEYPNTVKDVIFDTNYGVQYEPTANGTIYNIPDEESIRAAIDAFSGINTAGMSLFFYNPNKVGDCWISQNRQHFVTIGNHAFYL